MDGAQHRLILDFLSDFGDEDFESGCSPSEVGPVLLVDHASPVDMRAVSGAIKNMLGLGNLRPDTGVRPLGKVIHKKIPTMRRIGGESRESFVFEWTVPGCPGAEIVVKSPRRQARTPSLTREYFMGARILNTLRNTMPTMVYTIGAFSCPIEWRNNAFHAASSEHIYVMYEKIRGDSVRTMLQADELTFKEWLTLFTQLLITLELAQRDAGFTHFDLHTENVMVRNLLAPYQVMLDQHNYAVTQLSLSPVIIDFGHACVDYAGDFVASFEHPNHGMLAFTVPGYDMYKFLVSSLNSAKGNLRNDIHSLFAFYGTDDPYCIADTLESVTDATSQYCREATFSPAATHTPQEFLEWIMNKDPYKKLLTKTVTRKPRYTFAPLRSPKHATIEHIKSALALTRASSDSYTLKMYHIRAIERYSERVDNLPVIGAFADELHILRLDALSLAGKDRDMLEQAFQIPTPRPNSSDVLIIPIRSSCEEKTVDVDDLATFMQNITPYLQFYYTIIELNLEPLLPWTNRFKTSAQFQFYSNHGTKVRRVIRWAAVLRSSIRRQ
jgi:serine/threonine protein kinase